jgi:hypothetical protein
MQIKVDNLSYGHIQDRVAWLDKNVGPRLFYLHNQVGSKGWRYHSQERTIEIEDEHWAMLFVLKWGA